jgi:hypothetical protein
VYFVSLYYYYYYYYDHHHHHHHHHISLLFLGKHGEAGHQLLPHLDSKMHSSEHSTVRDIQPSQAVQDRAGKEVQEDTVTEHDSSNGNTGDLKNGCRGPVAHVSNPAVDGKELPKICDAASDHSCADEYEHIKFVPHESYVVATGTWENLPNEMCRLCASTDEHPRQLIVGWLDILNEIIPDVVSYLFLFTDLFAIL